MADPFDTVTDVVAGAIGGPLAILGVDLFKDEVMDRGATPPTPAGPSAEELARQKRALEEMDARDAREARIKLARKTPGRTGTIMSKAEGTGAGVVSPFPFVME